jgi:hypothetical protein
MIGDVWGSAYQLRASNGHSYKARIWATRAESPDRGSASPPSLRTPDHVVLQVIDRVRTLPVFRHLAYSHGDLAARS